MLQSDAIKHLFIETVERAKGKLAFTVTNICIMDNHFHVMITPARGESVPRPTLTIRLSLTADRLLA